MTHITGKTIVGVSDYEYIVKKSRFIARAARADTPESAILFLENHRLADANHNCWAYKIGDNYRFHDDGEPGGSAGKPIFHAIENNDFDRVVLLVARYFGGIKLGIGGLVRAYGQTATRCLQASKSHFITKYAVIQISISFEYLNTVYTVFEEFQDIKKPAPEFTEAGVQFLVVIPDTINRLLSDRLVNATSGNASIKIIDTGYQ